MSTLIAVESRDVNLSAIKFPKGFNIRDEIDLESEEIERLGTSILKSGLISPLIVKPSGNGSGSSETFDLVAGFRRLAAMKAKGVRGTVPVRVLAFETAADAVLMNITENEKEKVHSADLARRLYQLEEGVYPGVAVDKDGNGAIPVPRAMICERTGLTSGYVGNLIRAWKNLAEQVRREWRKRDIPTDIVIKWGKLKTEEEQVAAFEKWKAEATAAAARKAAGLKREKKARVSSEEGESEGPKPRKAITGLLEKFVARRESEHLPARDLEVVDAKISTLRWVLGDLKRLTFT